MENSTYIDKRNYGIDLLRIISMFFIVLLHSLGRGGIIYNANLGSLQYNVSWFMETIAYCAVDIFALISGYVSYHESGKKTNYANYFVLWLEVIFYGVLVTFIFDILNIADISLRDYAIALTPVSHDLYWYFTAYTCLFVVMPIINNGIRLMDKTVLKKIFLIMLLIFSIFESVIDKFKFDHGYSFIWIMLLYIMGLIIKKCEIGKKLSNIKILSVMFILIIITYLYKIYGFDLEVLNIKINNEWLLTYTSPTILTTAILYIVMFSKIKFNKCFIKVIKFIAPSAFAVYILNNHRLIWDYVIRDLFLNIANGSIFKVIMYPLLFSLGFLIFAIFIDKIRQAIFKELNIKAFIEKVINKFI